MARAKKPAPTSLDVVIPMKRERVFNGVEHSMQVVGGQKGTLRYWLGRMAATVDAMEDGLITSAECQRRNNVFESLMRTQTQLRLLEVNGVDDAPDNFDGPARAIKVANPKTVTIRRGNTPKGPVEEMVVVYDTAGNSEEVIDMNPDLDLS